MYLYAGIADDEQLLVIPSFSLACLALRHTDIMMQIEVGIEQSSQSLTILEATTSGHRLRAPESFHGFGTE